MTDSIDVTGPVLVIGAAGLDVKGWAKGPLVSATSNQGRIRSSVGGVGRNIAENLTRLGVPTTLLSAVGDDGAGRRLLSQAREAGIDVSHVLVDPAEHTGSYLAVLDHTGDLSVSIDDMEALQAITPRFLNDRRRLFRDAAMIVIDANLSPQSLRTVFRLAAKHQVPVCADPTSPYLAHRLKPYLRQLYMITPNEAEAAALLDGRSIQGQVQATQAAQQLVSAGVDIAVITMAEKGVCYATSNESGRVPALDIEVVDFTGAGDALSAAIIFGLLEDFPINEAVRLGVSAAALTIQSCETVCQALNLEDLYSQLII